VLARDRALERVPALLHATREALSQHPKLHGRIFPAVCLAGNALLFVGELDHQRPIGVPDLRLQHLRDERVERFAKDLEHPPDTVTI
jgi:hypothetical protein